MSFVLALLGPIASWEDAERLAAATRDERFVTLVPGGRRHWLRRLPPSVHLDPAEAQAVIDDRAWDEVEFPLSDRRHALAETLLLATRALPAVEWTLRCHWTGDALRAEERLTPPALAARVRRSGLDRHVLYRTRGADTVPS